MVKFGVDNNFVFQVGSVPFEGSQVFEVYENIVRGYIRYPHILSNTAIALIKGLLRKDRTRRLGNMRNGPEDVKSHIWVRVAVANFV